MTEDDINGAIASCTVFHRMIPFYCIYGSIYVDEKALFLGGT